MHPHGQDMVAGPRLAQPIRATEEDSLHQRTIVVGDFNMNPYDGGMIGIESLHSVMAKSITRRKPRTFDGKSLPFFYNPMWSLFGDRTPRPSGTHYYDQDTAHTPYWHMIDQVLLRPDLIDHLSELAVLSCAGKESLLTASGRPSPTAGSDHLPLYFQLKWQVVMSESVKSLWPELPTTVASPVVILKQQARYFNEKYGETMHCDIHTSDADFGEFESKSIQHEMLIQATVIGYTHSLLTATHGADLPYPVIVEARTFPDYVRASTQDEFIDLISKTLSSNSTLTVLHAIVARISSLK